MNRRCVIFALTTAVFAMIAAYLWWQRPTIYGTFDSPDGHWRLSLTDIDPSPFQCTTVFSVEDRTSRIPLSGTRYVEYNDSERPSVTVAWGPGNVAVSNFAFDLSAEFDHGEQRWKSLKRPPTGPATAPAAH
jgi:hypothetical protein